MSTKIFVNLPVKDLRRSTEFFTALGSSFDARFTDENATCLVITEDICAELLLEPFFTSFTKKAVADTATSNEAILALEVESKARVDELVSKAVAAGGRLSNQPVDQGFMYGGGFEDPDGHLWEVFYMDPNAMPQAQE